VAVSTGDEDLASAPPRPVGSAPVDEPRDNSIARLLTLSDGVFAIAMTLLALDLKVPAGLNHPSDRVLRHQLAMNSGNYWAFVVSFFVVASYWGRHRQLMRAVETTHPALIRDTMFLLFFVAIMPFPASLIGNFGSVPIALAVYGGVNASASIALMALSRDVHRLHLRDDAARDYSHDPTSWMNLVIFLLCIPGGYLLDRHGPWILLLLAVPRVIARARRLRHRLRLRLRLRKA
jgi:TMEM175 potassium channel family protein